VLTEGIGLSPAVAAAVDPAATAVIQLVTVVLSEEGATR
jgi:hypothetical protein